jgi:threonine synthase
MNPVPEDRSERVPMAEWVYQCERCGSAEPANSLRWRCHACEGAFSISATPRLRAHGIERSDRSLWRYSAALPVAREHSISLGEGMTPLVSGSLAGRRVWFKNDGLLPTGSFKDRGAAVLVAHLRQLGVTRLIVDSSGNAAAAMAGYCAAAGIDCTVFAPATTSPGKLTQSHAFGAAIVLVEGNRDAVAAAAQNAAEEDTGALYASHNWHPVFVEGVKTWAMEVWEQLGEQSPQVAFVPTGGGSAFVGAHRGFAEMGGALPALVAAQPAACAPIVAAVDQNQDSIDPVTPGTTIAEGTRIGSPARQRQILDAIRDSGGWARAVTEEQIEHALRELWAQGLYVEPTAAVGAAACIDAVERGQLEGSGDVVVLLTGTGLKATDAISRILA